MERRSVVIGGGGLAAATSGGTPRERGFDGRIALVAVECHEPYIRPPLSKGYLASRDGLDEVFVQPSSWYTDNAAELLGTRVDEVDPGARSVRLGGGGTLRYDGLLLATGAMSRRLRVPGAEHEDVHVLRTIDDRDHLGAVLAASDREVAIVGAGCIGLEIAATARGFGNAVTVVGRTTVPLADALGDELGAVFEGLHREHGVRFRLSTECAAVDVEGGWIAGVVTAAGDCVPADLVVVGVGVVPEVALAAGIGLPTANGIEVGGSMATSVPGVFAADDVADAYLHAIERRLCSEHWANAIAGGRVAARGMPGERVSYNEIPYLYTDQYDRGMEYSGYAWLIQGAEVVYRGDPDAQEFLAFWTSGGWVVAGISLNVWDVNDQVQRIIRTGKRVDSASAADVDIPLSAL